MLHQSFVTQPSDGINYLSLFGEALDRAPGLKRFDAAVAYATRSGVLALDKFYKQKDAAIWAKLEKRWLVGIDYCRTEPIALQMLLDLPNSAVRIHAGRQVVARKMCTPVLPYHPKTYLLHGPKTIGAICGSGNLSANGLTKGHEIGNLMITSDPRGEAEELVRQICSQLGTWYTSTWDAASTVKSIITPYTEVYDSVPHLRAPTPTDDDCSETETLEVAHKSRRALGPEDLRQMRACKRLWLEAGNLHHNRGKGKPGNQLMLTPMSRVFFGFQARDLDPNTTLGDVAISFHGGTRPDCSLRFSDNSMDVLTLPVPGDGGPSAYDQQNLIFEKQPDGSFTLELGSAKDKAFWIKQSKLINGYHRMTSGRQWGVY